MTHSPRTPVIEDVTIERLEDDPYPIYARWRRETPVAYLPALGGWVVTRWDDCDAIGKSEELLSERNELSENFFGHNILNVGGAPHADLRAPFDTWLRPRSVKAYIEGATRPVAREYLSRIARRGRADLTTELLEKVSVRVVGNGLGLEDIDDETLQRWFHQLNRGAFDLTGDPGIAAEGAVAKDEVGRFYETFRERVLGRPDGTGFSYLVNSDTGDRGPRSFEETIGTVWVVILGGFQEPGHALAATMLGLLRSGQIRDVTADPSLIPAAVHEGIRWIAPFGTTGRKAVTDIEVGGTVIPAGDEINLVLGSANRDETRYDDAEAFDLHRPRLPVASFGFGAHFCAGHFFSRELERILLEEMVQALPNLRLDPEDDAVEAGFIARGVKRLPVVWDV